MRRRDRGRRGEEGVLSILMAAGMVSLPVTALAQRQMEHLGRGMVAIHQGGGRVFVSWRLLGTDPGDAAFNLYPRHRGLECWGKGEGIESWSNVLSRCSVGAVVTKTRSSLPSRDGHTTYRLAVAWQNVAYNQPAHPGFYLGHGMAPPPRPAIETRPAAASGGAGTR